MPKLKRPRHAPTEEWQQLELLVTNQEQKEYEMLRPVVLFGQSCAERAKQVGKPERTFRRKVDRFLQQGMASLFNSAPTGVSTSSTQTQAKDQPAPAENASSKRVGAKIKQFIIDLKAQHPPMRTNEIATVCYIKWGRKLDKRTIKRVLKSDLTPTTTQRRFPVFAAITDPQERRLAIIRLHSEGWTNQSIARYLQTNRMTVHRILKRWLEEGVAGLDDKSNAPKFPATKTDLATINQVRKLQTNPHIGEYRVHTALKQLGIEVSPRSCGRIMQRNRQLYGLQKALPKTHSPKQMPFEAKHRHQYWSVDVRYIEEHQLGGGHLYVISILENYSRAILCSVISRHQDLQTYLTVLYGAVRMHGIPDVLVSDSGAIFLAKQAQQIYQSLGIEKKEIARRQAWQNLIEAQWSVQHRLADYHFAQATTWEELLSIHEKWWLDFNYQEHWAHRERSDHRHSPAAVLGWVRGRSCEQLDLDRIFHSLRFNRKLSKIGYVRFRHWQLYGEKGLARQPAAVWLYKQTLTIEYKAVPLSEYTTQVAPDEHSLESVENVRVLDTPYKSPQLDLWPKGEVDWHLVLRRPNYAPRRPARPTPQQFTLFDLDKLSS